MRPWKKPSRTFSFLDGVVRVDRDVARALSEEGLRVHYDARYDYPHVVRSGATSPAQGFVAELHRWIWGRLVRLEERRELRDDEVIHHHDHDKLNNTVANLRALTRRQHALVHEKDRQRFGRRRRQRLNGFHRPLAPGPLRHLVLGENVGSVPATMPRSRDTPLRRLAEMLASVRDQVADLGCWVPRTKPRARWDDPDTYRLGLRRVRRRLSKGEAVLVGLMIVNRLDRNAVAAAIAASMFEVECLLTRPLVHDAIQHWLRTGGLPYLLLPRR